MPIYELGQAGIQALPKTSFAAQNITEREGSQQHLRFSDMIMQKADDIHTDSAAEQFDVDFSIMSAELARFIPALLGAFGGEDTSNIDG